MVQQNLCLFVLLLLQITGIWSANVKNESLIQSRVGFSNSFYVRKVPFMVSLRKHSTEVSRGEGIWCGASLISDSVVLTSAHCLLMDDEKTYRKPEEFFVSMGSPDLYYKGEETLDFEIKRFKTGRYSKETHDNDIALLFLDGKVPANHEYIWPVTLNDGPLTDNTDCKLFGWGYSYNAKYNNFLLAVFLPIWNYKTCQQRTDHGTNVHSNMFCAGKLDGGYYHADTCYRDKGGPLLCLGTQAGVISWNNDCGESVLPTVITDVSKYKSWIKKHVAVHGGSEPRFQKLRSLKEFLKSPNYPIM